MKRRTLILILLIVAVLGIGFVAFSLLHNGVSAKAKPTALEVVMARKARHMALPSAARALTNPVAASEENLRDAQAALCGPLRHLPRQRWQLRHDDG